MVVLVVWVPVMLYLPSDKMMVKVVLIVVVLLLLHVGMHTLYMCLHVPDLCFFACGHKNEHLERSRPAHDLYSLPESKISFCVTHDERDLQRAQKGDFLERSFQC